MKRFITSQLRHRLSRALTLGLGLVVAAAGFTLLTSAVDTGALEVRGTINRSFRPAYDLLVRPTDSYTPVERNVGLVRANYLSGIYGGISFQQWHEIEHVPGVAVAAPIANVGYVMPFEFATIPIGRFLDHRPFQLFRLDVSWVAQNGASRYPASPQFVYVERRDPMTEGPGKVPEQTLPDGSTIQPCSRFNSAPRSSAVFALFSHSAMFCFSTRSPDVALSGLDYGRLPAGFIGAVNTVSFPIMVAAIDPIQEDRLLDLGSTVTQGRMLQPTDAPTRLRKGSGFAWVQVPVLASSTTYVSETMHVTVRRLRVPSPSRLIDMLTSAGAFARTTTLASGQVAGTVEIPATRAYENLLDGVGQGREGSIALDNVWTSGPVRYRSHTTGLRPLPVRNPSSVYRNLYGESRAAWDNEDVQFRRLTPYYGNNSFVGGVLGTPFLRVVGRFDPAKLPGFSALSRVPLESYYPPELTGADATSRRALGYHPLLPTQNLGDYIAQPPLFLTTMRGLRPFLDPDYFGEVPYRHDPISVIRVRVAGVTGTDDASLARIRTVAQQIHERTGLSVDITAGSSPRPMLIDLPAGRFGRPPLLLRELWVEKGVAVRFIRALDAKSLWLFLLVLAVCVLFLTNAALASVRSRRREIGTLLCLGWSRHDVFRAVVGELALVGSVAGVAGAVVAWALVRALGLHLPAWRIAAVVPTSIVLAVVAGLVPAARASAGTPLDAVNPAVVDRATGRRVHGPLGIAAANLARVPARTLVAALGLFAGVAALAILVSVNAAFSHKLVGTLLGHAVSLQVRGVDFLSVGLVLGLAALSVADVLYVNLRERAPELVTLRTSGWRTIDLVRVVVYESIGIAVLAGVAGCAVAVTASFGLLGGIGLADVATGVAIGLGAALAAGIAGSVVPAARLSTLTPPLVLAEE